MKVEHDIVSCCLDHLVKHGDTDIFPYPFELKFFEQRADIIKAEISKLDISQYHPISLIESLIPKTKFGFRVAHQPHPVDTLVFTSLVLKIFDDIESGRDDEANMRAFSYRKVPGCNVEIFQPGRNFRDWLEYLKTFVFSDEYDYVIRTDISDYYQRIYRHRLENIIDSLSGQTAVVKRIEKIISDWRGNQSFGLPVGGNAARLLAEAALNDTDLALISEGLNFSRYVDDIVIFVEKGRDPYAVLAFLAKHLSENEGLSLNNQKTRILEWGQFLATLDEPGGEDEVTRDQFATEKLFWAAYGKNDLSAEALEELTTRDLAKELNDLLGAEYWDMGAIRVVLHAMRLVKNGDVAEYVRSNLETLVPFAKDICLLIEEFVASKVPGFEKIEDEVVDLLLSPRMQSLDCARAWFLELGVRKIANFNNAHLRKLDALTGTLDVRQIHLLRWRIGDVNYFRSRKTKVNEFQAWTQPTLIFGARCLPKDEYNHWIRGIRSRLQFPLGKEFADWCLSTYGVDPL